MVVSLSVSVASASVYVCASVHVCVSGYVCVCVCVRAIVHL